jgi:hypothetical protein
MLRGCCGQHAACSEPPWLWPLQGEAGGASLAPRTNEATMLT